MKAVVVPVQSVPPALTNKSLASRYDRLVAQATRRVELAASPGDRRAPLLLVARLNARGMRELNRRHRESEEKHWNDSLFPPLPQRG